MKIDIERPRSRFLSLEKDMALIVNKMLENNRLKKLLYYTTKDCLKKEDLTFEQSISMINKNIRIVPKLYIDSEELIYVIVKFPNYSPSKNPEFRNNVIEFDILCHYDQWNMGDFQLRPYKIAGEIDAMFDNQRLTGIGKLQFLGANDIIFTDEFGGLCLTYLATHGEEDKKKQTTPEKEEQFLKDFDKYIRGDIFRDEFEDEEEP